jgi:hypothetical protein
MRIAISDPLDLRHVTGGFLTESSEIFSAGITQFSLFPERRDSKTIVNARFFDF